MCDGAVPNIYAVLCTLIRASIHLQIGPERILATRYFQVYTNAPVPRRCFASFRHSDFMRIATPFNNAQQETPA